MRCTSAALTALALCGLPAAGLGAPDPAPAALRAALGAGARVVWPAQAAQPSLVAGLDAAAPGADAGARALRFLARHAKVLGLEDVELDVAGTEPGARQVVVQLQQRWGGLPVYRRGATVVLDSAGQRVRSVRLFVADVTPEPPADDVGAEAAIAAARQALAGKAAVAEGEPGLARRILPGPPARRVWQVVLSTIVPPGRMSVFVDAQSGEPVWVRRDVVH